MKYLAIVVLIGGITMAAQTPVAPVTMHITAMHRVSPQGDRTIRSNFDLNYITATIGNRAYKLEQLLCWGATKYGVGTDYSSKGQRREVRVLITMKHGRVFKDHLGSWLMSPRSNLDVLHFAGLPSPGQSPSALARGKQCHLAGSRWRRRPKPSHVG